MPWIIHGGADNNSNEAWLSPWAGGTDEQNYAEKQSYEATAIMMPFDGYIKEVTLRPTNTQAAGTDIDVYSVAAGSALPTLDGSGDLGRFDFGAISALEIGTGVAAWASSANAFPSKGDVIAFSLDGRHNTGPFIYSITIMLDPTT